MKRVASLFFTGAIGLAQSKSDFFGEKSLLRRLDETTDETTIPHKIFFTAARNLIKEQVDPFSENVLNIIKAYRESWEEPQAAVYFLEDETCLHGISEVKPEFVDFFQAKTKGPFKADICRLVSLYHHGGYFFEPDVEVIDKVRPEPGTSFAGIIGCEGRCFHPGFIASTPRHPVIEGALKILLEKYKEGAEFEDGVRPMQSALADAYDLLSEDQKAEVFLMERLQLDHVHHPYEYEHKFYPHVARQTGNGNCNIIYHDPAKEAIYFFEHILGTGGCVKGLIPHKMWFSFKTNIWETKEPRPHYENILNTVTEYRNRWGEPDAPVYFLDDDDCRAMIAEAFPALLPYFDKETVGAYKGDICRNAALNLHGGYYFDVDMLVVEKVEPRMLSTFVSTLSCGGGCFFQAFFASTANHPILQGSLEKMLEIYETDADTSMIGPITMANAYHEMQYPNREVDIELYQEMRLDLGPDYEYYPDVPRQVGNGNNNCNYIVHDPDRKIIFFFARFVGYGGCQPPEASDKA